MLTSNHRPRGSSDDRPLVAALGAVASGSVVLAVASGRRLVLRAAGVAARSPRAIVTILASRPMHRRAVAAVGGRAGRPVWLRSVVAGAPVTSVVVAPRGAVLGHRLARVALVAV